MILCPTCAAGLLQCFITIRGKSMAAMAAGPRALIAILQHAHEYDKLPLGQPSTTFGLLRLLRRVRPAMPLVAAVETMFAACNALLLLFRLDGENTRRALGGTEGWMQVLARTCPSS